MDTRERITAALNGETPDRTPFTVYNYFVDDRSRPEWQRLIEMGLGITEHVPLTKNIEHGVELSVEQKQEGGTVYDIVRKKTPAGTIQSVKRDGWHYEHWIKTPEDYEVYTWIVEHTEAQAAYENFAITEQFSGKNTILMSQGAYPWIYRSPLMFMKVELLGVEKFCIDMAMETDEFNRLYEAMKIFFLEEMKLIAGGPGRFVKLFENLTAPTLGVQRYNSYLKSLYDEMDPFLKAGNKRLVVHYDGLLNAIRNEIAEAKVDVIESLTEPPEGDITYDHCRECWPDKSFWCNINVDLYSLPEEDLKQAIREKRDRAGKRGLVFEISEELPANWETAIPIVLETLEEMD